MEIKDKELHRIAVTAIIYKPDFSYLVIKRGLHKKVMPGKWAVPGGGVTTDDYTHLPHSTEGAQQWYGSLERALRREVREEVNLEIGEPELLIDLTFIRSDGIPVLCLSYFAPYLSGEVKLDEDATEFKWIKADEVSSIDLVDGIAKEILKIEVILRTRKVALDK